MNRNKICPDCEIEYLPHIEKCADCGAVLLLHEEHKRAQEEKKLLMAEAIENSAVVVAHYYLSIDAMTQPMQVKQDITPYGGQKI